MSSFIGITLYQWNSLIIYILTGDVLKAQLKVDYMKRRMEVIIDKGVMNRANLIQASPIKLY